MSQTEKVSSLLKEQSRQCAILGNYQALLELIGDSQDAAMQNATFLDELMQQMEIHEHTAAILCLLSNKISITGVNFEQMFGQIQEFINECTEVQVRALPNLYASLCRHMTDKLVESKQYLKGVDLLCKAIGKLQLQPSQLTSVHCDLLKLCLLSKCLKPALTFLDVDISDISREADTFDVKYYLMYYYYGGIIYCTLRNFDRALFFFRGAISVSGNAISEIVVEAYKKFILVSLLVSGKITAVPKQNSAYINRCVRPLTGPYHDLANAYGTDSDEELQKVFSKHQVTYGHDTNIGLVKQVIASMVKVKIQKLTKTFMTLSFGDMAAKVNLTGGEKEAEKIILQMIEDKEIFATINQRDGMVVFTENPEKYNNPMMYRMLEKELNKCVKLNEKLKELDQDVALNPKYQKIRSVME